MCSPHPPSHLPSSAMGIPHISWKSRKGRACLRSQSQHSHRHDCMESLDSGHRFFHGEEKAKHNAAPSQQPSPCALRGTSPGKPGCRVPSPHPRLLPDTHLLGTRLAAHVPRPTDCFDCYFTGPGEHVPETSPPHSGFGPLETSRPASSPALGSGPALSTCPMAIWPRSHPTSAVASRAIQGLAFSSTSFWPSLSPALRHPQRHQEQLVHSTPWLRVPQDPPGHFLSDLLPSPAPVCPVFRPTPRPLCCFNTLTQPPGTVPPPASAPCLLA